MWESRQSGGWRGALRCAAAVAVGVLALGAHPAAAQNVVPFEAAGTTHVVQHPPDRAKEVQAVIEATEAVVEILQPLWTAAGGAQKSSGISFQLNVILSPELPPDARANAVLTGVEDLPAGIAATRSSVCRIVVFDYLLDETTLFAMAHEIAHCYQSFFIPGRAQYAVPGTEWWVEGSADWMALLVYPNASWSNLAYNDYTTTTHRNPLFSLAYDGVFFFEFLASPRGLGSVQAVIEFLRGMPPTPPAATGYEAYLTAAVPDVDELMHNFVVAMAGSQLPHSPPIMTSNGAATWAMSALPEEVPVETQPWSIEYYKLIGMPLQGDGGLRFEGLNLDNTGVRVSLMLEGNAIALVPGTPVDICDAWPLEWYLAVSLAASRGGVAGDSLVRISPITKEECVGKEDTATAGMATIPNCLAGDWIVTTIPDLAGLLPGLDPAVAGQTSINQHTILFSLAGDGDYRSDFTVRASTPQATTIIHAAIAGRVGLVPSQVRGNSYDVLSVTAGIVPGTASGAVQVGGLTIDVTDTLGAIFTDAGNLLPYPEHLTCGDDGALLYVAVIDGAEQIWVMRRP